MKAGNSERFCFKISKLLLKMNRNNNTNNISGSKIAEGINWKKFIFFLKLVIFAIAKLYLFFASSIMFKSLTSLKFLKKSTGIELTSEYDVTRLVPSSCVIW